MEQVKAILALLQLEDLTSRFEDECVDDESLFLLNSEDIALLIPQIGKRAKFRHYLEILRQSKPQVSPNLQAATDSDSGSCCTVTPSETEELNNIFDRKAKRRRTDSSTHSTSKKTNAYIELDLDSLLNRELNGKAILQHYMNHNTLNEEARRKLVDLIIDELLNQSEKLSNRDLEVSSRKITEYFPSERPEIYYCPPSSAVKIARGKLVDKYRNKRRIFKWYGVFEGKPAKQEEDDSSEVLEDNCGFNWLKYNVEPWSKVTECWQATQEIRLRQLSKQDFTTVADYLKKWPILRQTLGHTLIDLDFAALYPGKEGGLLSTWNRLLSKLHPYLKENVGDTLLKRNLNVDFENQSEDTKALYIFLALPHVCKPAAIRRLKGSPGMEGHAERKAWKPSSVESQEGMFLHIENSAEVSETLEKKRSRLRKYNSPFQPLAVAVGPAYDLQAFYVFIDGIFYKMDTFIKAVDLAFKSFFILHAAYPFEAYQLWYFIQVAAFQIQTKWDKPCPNVLSLLSSLGL